MSREEAIRKRKSGIMEAIELFGDLLLDPKSLGKLKTLLAADHEKFIFENERGEVRETIRPFEYRERLSVSRGQG